MADQTWSDISDQIGSTELSDTDIGNDMAQPARYTVEFIIDHLFPTESFEFDPSLVEGSLREVLLLLILARREDVTGRNLIRDLEETVGQRYETAIIYHTLHGLEESGLIESKGLENQKVYSVTDSERVEKEIAEQMRQNMAIGYVLFHALETQ